MKPQRRWVLFIKSTSSMNEHVTPTFHYGLASQLYSYVMSQTSENSELSEWWERQTEFFSHNGNFMWNYNQSEFPKNCDKFSQTIKNKNIL